MGHYIQDGKLYIDDVNIENEAFANLDLGEDLNVYLINTKVIGYKAFANAKIKSITIPYTVEYIGDYAFSGCKNITITHENTETKTDLSTIGKGAFMDCSNSNITIFFTGVDAKRLSDMVFYNCKGGYIYSDTVEFIGDSAFYNSNISINGHWDNLSKIGNYAFYNCTGDSVGTYCNNNLQ